MQNSPPIGDAQPCSGKGAPFRNLSVPQLFPEFRNNLICVTDDPWAMTPDNKSQPGRYSPVEYAHRLATRTIEYLQYAKAQGKNFFVGVSEFMWTDV